VEIKEIEKNITKVFGEFENFIFVGYSKGAESTLTVGNMKDQQFFTNHLGDFAKRDRRSETNWNNFVVS